MRNPRFANRFRLRRVLFLLLPVIGLLILLEPQGARLASAPTLIAKDNSTRAVAVESTTFLSEPFAATSPVQFSQDNRTRVILFASNLNLLQGDTAASVTADAEDGNHIRYPLTVEYIGTVPNFSWMTAVIVRLNDNLGDVGDVLIGINLHGALSNRVRVGIGHVGGGPPDDVVLPQPP